MGYRSFIFLLITTFLLPALQVFGQEGQGGFSISGKVMDGNWEALPGATVYIHELNKGSSADKEGYYEIKGISKGNYHLHIQFLGYRSLTKTLKLRNDTVLNFELKESAVEMHEVIVEAHGVKSSIEEQSRDIKILTGERMMRKSAAGVLEATADIEGVDFINSGTGISKPVIRGMGFNRVATAKNGVKQEGQQWGADHGLEIDPYSASRIEIIKGPASLIYGSEAMNGIINIKSEPVPKENSLSGSITGTGHSNTGLYGGSAYMEGNANGFFGSLRYSHKKYGDIMVPADSFNYNTYVYPLYGNSIKNTAGEQSAYSASIGLNKDWGVGKISYEEFNQTAGFFPGTHGRPDLNDLQPDGDKYNIGYPFQTIQHQRLTGGLDFMIGENWIETNLTYQKNTRREREPFYNHGAGPQIQSDTALSLILETYSLNFHYHHELNDKWSNVYGVSGRAKNNKIGGGDFLIPDFERYNTGAYALFKYKQNGLINYSGGLRADAGRVEISGFSQPIYNDSLIITGYDQKVIPANNNFTSLSGSVGLSWLPTESFNLKFNLGSGFRYPTVPELASNGLHHGVFRFEEGKPDLRPERNYSADLALILEQSHSYFKLTPFFNYYDDYIYIAPTGVFSSGIEGGGQKYKYRQANAINTGGELLIDVHTTDDFHLALIGEYVWNYNLKEEVPLPFTPPPKVKLQLNYELRKGERFKNTYIEVLPQYSFAQNFTARNEKTTPGYFLLNATMGTCLQLGKQEIKFYLSSTNILNNNYLRHLSIFRPVNLPEAGRNIKLTVKVPIEIIK